MKRLSEESIDLLTTKLHVLRQSVKESATLCELMSLKLTSIELRAVADDLTRAISQLIKHGIDVKIKRALK